jgi:hypothetical protein
MGGTRRARAPAVPDTVALAFAVAPLAFALALSAGGEPIAHAQLHASVDRLAEAWRGVGASVIVDKPRFLNDDETLVLSLPDASPDSSPPADGVCTTLVLLGSRGMGFHVRPADRADDEPTARIPSEAGALSIERCGAAPVRRLLVTSDSGRGALETLIARSSKPLESMRSILPERTGGTTTPAPEPGLLPPMPAPEKRADATEARARRDGGTVLGRTTWVTGVDGTGAGDDTLEPGCHTLQLFAVDPRASNPAQHGKLDLDAEMRDATGDRVLARDRTDAPDARLELCVGETTEVQVAFVGSIPGAPVLVTHVASPLPDRLPVVWGSEARAHMAHVLLSRHVRSLLREPVLLAQGGSGSTSVPVTVEPGACYLAVVAIVQGAARSVSLRVHTGVRDAFDDRGVDENGAVVVFCAGDRTGALAEVEARGTPLLGWGMALYRMGSSAWEVSP